MGKGRFVTFEGTDGAGKSTQIGKLERHLRARGDDVIVTREPGGCPLSEALREILLDARHADINADMTPQAEAYLYAAARAQHVRRVIRPALERGAHVLCDRYIDSSLAYQGAARGLGIDEVWALNRLAIEDCMPDITFLLMLPPADSLTRREAQSAPDRLESEGVALQERVYRGFEAIQRRYPERIRRIDASRSIEEIAAVIRSAFASIESPNHRNTDI